MKKLLALLLIAVMLCLAACSSDAPPDASSTTEGSATGDPSLSSNGGENPYGYEDAATQLTEATTYYNDFLGLRYTVPSGWWLYEVNVDNFSTSQGVTADEMSLDLYGDESTSYFTMLSFANLQHSNRDNHLGFQIDAERIDGIETLADYAQSHIDFMVEPYEDEEPYQLLDQQEITVGGRPCQQTIFLVPQSDQSDYNIVSLLFEGPNGYYIGIHCNYWPDSPNALDNILNAVEGQMVLGS